MAKNGQNGQKQANTCKERAKTDKSRRKWQNWVKTGKKGQK